MVLLTVTPAVKEAIKAYHQLQGEASQSDEASSLSSLAHLEVDSPVAHHKLVELSRYLVQHRHDPESSASSTAANEWRLDLLLKGTTVYRPPPPPKREPTPEYKALMQRLRQQEEQRQYERMINPPLIPETFGQRFPSSASAFNPATSHGTTAPDDIDEVTYADVNRQMILIINILVSIVCTSVFVWIAARRWSVPQRLGLSMSGSGLVAAAEVAIYMGYIRRLKEAKLAETKKVEVKEIVDTWTANQAEASGSSSTSDATRFRKGRHR